jgi:DNA-binding SARP family transcriptional activator
MAVSIIPTKIIIPKRAPGVIRRARLLDYLHENLGRKLMLVTAPAGYGKTTLLVDFAGDVDLPACWYTLDEGDRDPTTFLAYLIAAIRQKYPEFGERSQPLAEHGSPSAHAAAAALVADMVDAIPDYFVLVLDDWHLVSEEAPIIELIDQLLRYLPEHAHVIVAGRTLLRGPLVRLAAQGAVAGLGASDLRFNADEVREVLAAKYKLQITPEQAAQLAEESEGWITAIVLTSQDVWRTFLAGLARARDAEGTVFEYLAGEVFDRLPDELRRFLFDSAILRQFTAELCDEIRQRQGAQEWIDQAETRNLFLTRIDVNGVTWFRYHHLFRDFLMIRFKRDDLDRYIQLQQRAGEWFEHQHQPEEAVDHYWQANALEQTARVMNDSARDLFLAGRLQTVGRWAEMVPASHRAKVPELILYQAQMLIDRGILSDALQLLQEARAVFAAHKNVAGQVRAELMKGWAHYAAGHLTDAFQAAESVLQQIQTVDIDNLLLYAQALRLKGACFNSLGQWQAAEPCLVEALKLYRDGPSDGRRPFNLGRTMHDLANTLRSMGRLEEATALQSESLVIWRKIGNPASLAHCLNNMGYDRYVAGDYDEALTVYTEGLIKADEADDRRAQALITEGIAAVHRERGEFDQSLGIYASVISLAGSLGDQSLVSLALDGLGHTHRLANDPERALALFQQARSIAERENFQGQIHLSNASIGIARIERGDDEGLVDLRHAATCLREMNAYLDLGRVLLWLARGSYWAGDNIAAKDALVEVVQLGRRLGCRPFGFAEGCRAKDVLEWGNEKLSNESHLHKWISEFQKLPARIIENAPSPAVRPHIEVRALGMEQVLRNGQTITMADWGRSINARHLFFYLLEQPPRRKEEIGVQFWPDHSSARMTSSFHAAKYRMRRAVGMELVEYDGERYHINPTVEIWYDVAEFRRLAEMARHASRDEERLDLQKRAVELYGGDYLLGVDTEWATRTRGILHQQFFEILNALIKLLLKYQRFEEIIVFSRRGLELDYFHEELHRAVMLSLAATGHITGSLQHYETVVSRLASELSVVPAPETVNLAKRIRTGSANIIHQ